VDDEVHEVVAPDVEAAEMVVEGQGEVAHEAAGVVTVSFAGEEPSQVVDDVVADDGVHVVEDKGDGEGVGVGHAAHQQHQGQLDSGPGEKAPLPQGSRPRGPCAGLLAHRPFT
jgi:hypothetical protein